MLRRAGGVVAMRAIDVEIGARAGIERLRCASRQLALRGTSVSGGNAGQVADLSQVRKLVFRSARVGHSRD